MCSHIVSFFLFSCFSSNFACFAESTIKIGFSPQKSKKTHTKITKILVLKNWSKLVLKPGPSMLRNIIGPVFNTRIGSFFGGVILFFFKILFFLQGEHEKVKN